MRKQTLTYDHFSDWAGHMFTMIGLRLKAKDKAVIKSNTFKDMLYQPSWKQWNHIRPCKKQYGRITTTLETRGLIQVGVNVARSRKKSPLSQSARRAGRARPTQWRLHFCTLCVSIYYFRKLSTLPRRSEPLPLLS